MQYVNEESNAFDVVEVLIGFLTRPVGGSVRHDKSCSTMTWFDLTKATVTCGVLAFLIYSFPVVGQILIIGSLALLWLSYARKTVAGFFRR